MPKFAKLDIYDYSFIYERNAIKAIDLHFDYDDMVTLTSVSTDITSHDGLVYLEGRRFKQVEQNIIKTNNNYILEILVEPVHQVAM